MAGVCSPAPRARDRRTPAPRPAFRAAAAPSARDADPGSSSRGAPPGAAPRRCRRKSPRKVLTHGCDAEMQRFQEETPLFAFWGSGRPHASASQRRTAKGRPSPSASVPPPQRSLSLIGPSHSATAPTPQPLSLSLIRGPSPSAAVPLPQPHPPFSRAPPSPNPVKMNPRWSKRSPQVVPSSWRMLHVTKSVRVLMPTPHSELREARQRLRIFRISFIRPEQGSNSITPRCYMPDQLNSNPGRPSPELGSGHVIFS